MNIVPNTDVHDNKTAQDVDQLNKVVTTLLDRLQGEAAVGDSVMKFAIGNMSGPNMNMYGMVQCTPDLTYLQCSECVGGIIENFPRCCYGNVAARVLAPSCRFSYKLGPFNSRNGVDSPDAPPADDEPSQPPPRSITGNGESKIKIIIIVPTIIFVILVCFGIYICLRKRKQRTLEDKYNGLDDISSVEYLQYDFDTIEAATRYFSDSNKLGHGGFRAVYKGTLLNGREIAVKRLFRNSGQGEQELKNEVSLLGKLQHRSLVMLLGFSLKAQKEYLSMSMCLTQVLTTSCLAWKKWRDGRTSDVIDPLLTHGASSIEDIKKCIHVTLLCVQQNVADGPTMASVVHMLNSTSQTFQVPSEPAFFSNDSTASDYITTETNDSSQILLN